MEKAETTVLRGYSRAFAQAPYTMWSSVLRNLLGLTTEAVHDGIGSRRRIRELVGSILEPEEEVEAVTDNLTTTPIHGNNCPGIGRIRRRERKAGSDDVVQGSLQSHGGAAAE